MVSTAFSFESVCFSVTEIKFVDVLFFATGNSFIICWEREHLNSKSGNCD